MSCRVGVKPRATGVYKKVHEDCEMAKTTPPKAHVRRLEKDVLKKKG